MNKTIDAFFDLLNLNEITYVVLRGYDKQEIYESEDIDLYVSDKDFNRFDKIMLDNQWFTPKFNLNKMFHKQYFLFEPGKRIKIDVVNKINFGNKHKELQNTADLMDFRNILKDRNFYTLNPNDSLIIFLLHLIYDKREISDDNLKRLKFMYAEVQDENLGYFQYDCSKLSLNQLTDLSFMEKSLTKEVKFESKESVYLSYKFKWYCTKIVSELWCLQKKKMISIIGVDGTGKSTTISILQKYLGNHCKLQYMGFTRYTSIFARKYNGKKVEGLVNNFIETLCVYFEMWIRYLSNRFYRHKIILYDRFVNESYINANGIRKVMVVVLFKWFFPKPKTYYYLHCPIETSLSRKDDILDVDHFTEMKRRFDAEYLENKKVKAFDTSKLTSEEIAKSIYLDISKQFPDFLV